jgi:ribonuclease HI
VKAWIDGSSCYTPKEGKCAGAAYLLETGYFRSEYLGDQGSNIAELEALRFLIENVGVVALKVYTDSKFLYNSFYRKAKIQHGSRRLHSLRQTIQNRDVEIVCVPGGKGHSLHAKVVDNLAKRAAKEKVGSSGWLDLKHFY